MKYKEHTKSSFKRTVKNNIVFCFQLYHESKIRNEETKRGNVNYTNTRLNYNLQTTKFLSHNLSTICNNWKKVHVANSRYLLHRISKH